MVEIDPLWGEPLLGILCAIFHLYTAIIYNIYAFRPFICIIITYYYLSVKEQKKSVKSYDEWCRFRFKVGYLSFEAVFVFIAYLSSVITLLSLILVY